MFKDTVARQVRFAFLYLNGRQSLPTYSLHLNTLQLATCYRYPYKRSLFKRAISIQHTVLVFLGGIRQRYFFIGESSVLVQFLE